MAMTELRPGRYPVRWRESQDDPWHAAGSLDVKALAEGAYYEVQVGASSMRVAQLEEGSAE
jgi:hypothetical protein